MKKISLLMIAMIILASCAAKAPTEEKAVEVDANGTEVNVGADGVEVDTDGTSVNVGADGVDVETSTTTETSTETTTTTETTTEKKAEDTSSNSDSSANSNTSVKIDGNSVDVNAGGLDVKIN